MTPLATAAAAPEVAVLPIGAVGPPFEGLLGSDGHRYGFSSFADSEVLVLIFASNRCPTVKAYADRMKAVHSEYGRRGVQLVAINSNSPHLYPDESYPLMVERAALDGYTFPYLADPEQRVARAYGAACTFHLFVLDRDRRLRYQGRFDDARLEANITSHDLRDALDDILDGREVRTPATRPFGCSLDFV
ncbi:MAG TPA: thioredoxin family protein [Methylomirabilota bacterium]|jgi:peroxiredoxin|nr:thioredoxin family protein [Methylomirabilota bacterium]